MKKAKKKTGPKGPRNGSAASCFRDNILKGLSDQEVYDQVKGLFPGIKDHTKFYRYQLRRQNSADKSQRRKITGSGAIPENPRLGVV